MRCAQAIPASILASAASARDRDPMLGKLEADYAITRRSGRERDLAA